MTQSLLTAMLATMMALTCVLPAAAQPGQRQRPAGGPGHPTLAVTGRGEVKTSPDTAVITLGAEEQAEEAQAAQDGVNRVLEAALERIKALGIPAEQIQTAGLSLHPVYNHEQRPRPAEGQPSEPRVVGYRASNTVQVEVRDLAQVGDVIDAALTAGVNQLQGLNYTLREDAEAKQTALQRAVEKARAEAEAVAAALQMRIGGVDRVEVGDIGFRPPMPMARGMMMAEAAMAPTPTEPGQVRVDANVTIVYRLTGGAAGRGAVGDAQTMEGEGGGAGE